MAQIVYWRSELPPLCERMEGEHEVDATSDKVHYTLADRGQLWATCYRKLIERAENRIVQEVKRLGGSCAHVTEEAIVARQDDATGEFWLAGTFRFVMYVHPLGS
jgi:hypothetical protein